MNSRLRRNARDLATLAGVAALLALLLASGGRSVAGAEPEPSYAPGPTAGPPICGLYPGWAPGDQWGPGPDDVVTCPDDSIDALRLPDVQAEPTGEIGDALTGTPAPAVTLPPTDTE